MKWYVTAIIFIIFGILFSESNWSYGPIAKYVAWTLCLFALVFFIEGVLR